MPAFARSLPREEADLPEWPLDVSPAESRRSFVLNAINGSLFNFAETLMDPNLVLVWLVSALTSSNLLIAAISTIGAGSWFLPQLFLSGWVQSKSRTIVIYRWAATVRILTWMMLVASLWWIEDRVPLLIAFFVLYTVMKLMAGMAGLPFMEVTARTVPAWWRGRLFAVRQLLGGLLGLVAGWLVKQMLGRSVYPFPRNFAVLFFVAALSGSLALLIFSLIREPAGQPRPVAPIREQVRRGWRALLEDRDFRHFTLGRMSLFLGMVAIPFFTIVARQVLQAPSSAAGEYLLIATMTALVFNYPFGVLVDRRGKRWGMLVAATGWGMTAAFALFLVVAASRGWLSRFSFPPYRLAYPLFFLRGFFTPFDRLAGYNLLLEIAPQQDRILYLGFANTLFGIVMLMGTWGGKIVDHFGLASIFVISIALNALAAFFFLHITKGRGVRSSSV